MVTNNKCFYRYRLAAMALSVLALLSMPAAAHSDDLAYYLPPAEVIWLGAEQSDIDTAIENEQDIPLRALMLHRENEQAYDRGNLLLVPELGTHPLQSAVLRHWYQGMPAYGWYTYGLQSPLQQVHDFTWDQEFGQRHSAANDISSLKDAMRERLELALAHVEQTSGPLVLISEGVSAALIIQLLHQGEMPQVDAVVLLGSYFPQQQLNSELATQTAQLRIPVLDMIPAQQQPWVAEQQARRVQQSQRHQHPSYRQRVLSSQRIAEQPRYVLHQLYGWLRYEDF